MNNVEKLNAQKAAVLPKAPDVSDILAGKANEALAAKATPTWESVRESYAKSFRELGESGARGNVSLMVLGQRFAAAVATGFYTTADAKTAYTAYCEGWNAFMLFLPEHERGDMLDLQGPSFDSSCNAFKTFGLLGAVAQGATVLSRDTTNKVHSVDWQPSFFKQVSRVVADIKAEDRIGSPYTCQVAANRAAHGKLDATSPWDTPAMTDEEIAAVVTKPVTNANQMSRCLKALDNAMKSAKRISPEMYQAIAEARLAAEKIGNAILAAENGAEAALELIKANTQARYAKTANTLPAE